jgi:hypothetical protein
MISSTFNTVKKPVIVLSSPDFKVTGEGIHPEWQRTGWTDMQKLDKGGKEYESKFKILYSANGIYVLFHGEDHLISSSFNNDFDPLFKGDVFEVFFHPEPGDPLYLEYEISPLNKELALLMVKREDYLGGWAPWPYENDNRIKKNVCIYGGEMKPRAEIKSWTAELFIPYTLMGALNNTPPSKGTLWNANFCRLDYDTGEMIKWAWAPVENSFHELDRYFPLIFG